MSVPAIYPGAEQRMLGMAPGKWSGKGEWKLCLHTTEGSGLSDYDPDDDAITGEYAPHLTYWPAKRKWVQDYRLDRPSESVRTFDDDQLYQVEIICYSQKSKTIGRPWRLWVGNLDDGHLQDIADFTNWLRGYVEIDAVWPEKAALSYAEANADGFRYTSQEFWNFNGILAHQHTPKPNTHWDTGAFRWDKFMSLIKTGEEIMLPLVLGDDSEDIRLAKDRINQTYGTNLNLASKVYDFALKAAAAKHLGGFTGSPGGSRGDKINATMWNGLLLDFVKKHGGGGGGVSEARVKQLIAATKLVP